MRALVVLVASVLSGLALYAGRPAAELVAGAIFHVPPASVPPSAALVFNLFYTLFLVGAVFPFFLFVGWLSLAPPGSRSRPRGPPPYVSVLIPAFNEEGAIAKCLRAAARQDYPAFEIIVVDDGSTDLTLPQIETAAVTCIRARRNSGKAQALNTAVERAGGEILVFSDSDSALHPEALRHLVRPFSDPTVGAVAGTVIVDDARSLLRRWQLVEYLHGQAVIKTAQLASGSSIAVLPGVIFAVRRAVFHAAGGFKTRTLTEDFDLTLDIIESGSRAVYEPRALAFTEAPRTWRELRQQRLRWSRGALQVILGHRGLLFSARRGALGLFWLPYFLIAGYGGALLELVAIVALPFLAWASTAPVGLLKLGLVYFALLESFNWAQSALAVVLARQPFSLACSALIIQPYRLFLNFIRLWAVAREIRGEVARWSS